jgi:hypothetical protein
MVRPEILVAVTTHSMYSAPGLDNSTGLAGHTGRNWALHLMTDGPANSARMWRRTSRRARPRTERRGSAGPAGHAAGRDDPLARVLPFLILNSAFLIRPLGHARAWRLGMAPTNETARRCLTGGL